MKPFFFLLILLSVLIAGNAQTEGASGLYGYKQEVMPGTIRVDDNGNEIPRKKQFNYIIYLASSVKVDVQEMWINGEVYSVETRKVSSTPIEYINPTSGDNTPVILVPKTARNVLQLNSSGKKIDKFNNKGRLLSRKNELVIIYGANGKLYYKAVSKLESLKRVAMQ